MKQLLIGRITAAEVLQESVSLVDDFIHVCIVFLRWTESVGRCRKVQLFNKELY